MTHDILIRLLVLVVSVTLPAGLALINKWLTSHHLASQVALVDSIVSKAVAFAEEQASKSLKTNTKLDSDVKLQAALTFATTELDRLGLTKIAADQLTKLLEAKVNVTRS